MFNKNKHTQYIKHILCTLNYSLVTRSKIYICIYLLCRKVCMHIRTFTSCAYIHEAMQTDKPTDGAKIQIGLVGLKLVQEDSPFSYISFHVLLSLDQPTGFSFYILSDLLAIFILLSSNNNKKVSLCVPTHRSRGN